MKVTAISDLHGNLPEIEPCDLLLISGDICPHVGVLETVRMGRRVNVRPPVGGYDDLFFQSQWLLGPFADWLNEIPAKHIVATSGNHDWVFEKRPHLVPKNLRWTYLQDSGTEIEGLKIWGSPWQLNFFDWAFNAPLPHEPDGEEFLKKKFDLIPDDTDIIIVHGPPYGYGDLTNRHERTGSRSLTDRIMKIKPKLMCCGHIHSGRGMWEFERSNMAPGIIANVSILDEAYRMVHKPMVFEL